MLTVWPIPHPTRVCSFQSPLLWKPIRRQSPSLRAVSPTSGKAEAYPSSIAVSCCAWALHFRGDPRLPLSALCFRQHAKPLAGCGRRNLAGHALRLASKALPWQRCDVWMSPQITAHNRRSGNVIPLDLGTALRLRGILPSPSTPTSEGG